MVWATSSTASVRVLRGRDRGPADQPSEQDGQQHPTDGDHDQNNPEVCELIVDGREGCGHLERSRHTYRCPGFRKDGLGGDNLAPVGAFHLNRGEVTVRGAVGDRDDSVVDRQGRGEVVGEPEDLTVGVDSLSGLAKSSGVVEILKELGTFGLTWFCRVPSRDASSEFCVAK